MGWFNHQLAIIGWMIPAAWQRDRALEGQFVPVLLPPEIAGLIKGLATIGFP